MKREDIRDAKPSESGFYTIHQVAEHLQVHSNTVAKLIRERKITAVKVAGVWRISQIALDSYINSRTVKAAS